jgi:hypothetical protein
VSQFVLLTLPYQQLNIAATGTAAIARESEEHHHLFPQVWNDMQIITGRVPCTVNSVSQGPPKWGIQQMEERSVADCQKDARCLLEQLEHWARLSLGLSPDTWVI